MIARIGNRTVWLNFNHLYYLWVSANEDSLLKASKKLGIGQSGLSIQLKQFEEHLGIELFVRSHRKLALSDQGKLVYSYAKEVFQLGNDLVEALNDRPAPNRVHLQLGVLDSIPKHLTTGIVDFALKEKKCFVSVHEGKPEELFRELTHHRIDLLLTDNLPTMTPGIINSKKVSAHPLHVVGSRKYSDLRKGFPASLDRKPIILSMGENRARQEFADFCKLNSINPNIVAEAQDIMIQKMLALRGVGLVLVPKYSVIEYIKRKELQVVGTLPDIHQNLFLVSASRKMENPVAAKIIKDFSF